jgi:two-component system CheB/CheR fusion protein
MPADSGAAFVLIQHLDPHHESLTAEILTRCTTMAVVQVDAPMPIRPNTVYVIPPNAYLCLRDNTLHQSKPVLQRGLRMPVDNFFRSLAEERRERAIGIIVSGTGSDGTLGIKALKAYGGLVIAQAPESAQYDGMPRSAIATGLVDIVCPIEAVPEALERYLQHAYVREPDHPQELLGETEDFRSILALLQERTNHDFRPYKKGTLGRRIARRMGLHHIESLADYLKLIRTQPDEATQLLNDLLIGVTAFFRDSEAFKVLDTQVLTPLIHEKPEDAPLRVWTPGCASGEEAYAIAMLLTKRLAASHRHNPLQVFATDIDETALAVGRAGIYPRTITADVDADRLQRFFLRHEDSFQVNKSLRECVTFAQQNLIADPPFSKIDLISCRNLLIYLEPEVQSKVIALFHFALNDGGYLFLGNAETIGPHASLFEPVSKKWRLYRRVGPTHPVAVDFPITRSRTRPSETSTVPALAPESARLARIAQQALLHDYAPAAVLVNRKHQVVYFSGPMSRYLNQPVGAPTSDLLSLVCDGLLTRLRAALHTAAVEQSTIHIDDARMNRDGSYVRVKLTVRPVVSGLKSEKLLLVTFEDQSAVSAKDAGRADESHEPLVQQLE